LYQPPLLHFCFNLFNISKTFATKVLLAYQTDGSQEGPSPGCKVDVQEVPTIVLEFSHELHGLYGVWHCHDEAVGQLAWTFSANCIPKLQQNFTVLV
jgi:hypothetical protein